MINSIQFEKNTAEQTKKAKKLPIKSFFILSWLVKYLCRR